MRILVCEDDFLILMNTAEMLRDLGHAVEEAADAAAALAVLGAGPLDVLFTDIGLPDMDGVELARRARALQPELAVVFASGAVEVDGLGGGAVAVLPKPYNLAQIEAALDAVAPG